MDIRSLTLEEVKGNLNFLRNLYDIARIVDPIKKKVLDYSPKGEAIESRCFNFWKTGRVCENCVSSRAYLKDDSYMKVQYNGDKVYIIMAVPIYVEGKKVVVELLKDVTHSGMIEDINVGDAKKLYYMLKEESGNLIKDQFTNTYNKNYIYERLPYEMSDSSIKNTSFSVVMIDIDCFKLVNDKYGHLAGDHILKEFVNILKGELREDKDWLARFGGDEFLIFLKDCDKSIAYNIMKRIKKKIEKTTFVFNDTPIKITSSFGIHTDNDKKLTVDEMIEKADKNLYIAKGSGRNCVIA